MLPAVVSQGKAVKGILAALALLVSSSYLLVPWTKSPIYVIGISLFNVPLMVAGLGLYRKGTKRAGWWLFKLTSPYIVIVLFSFMVERFLFA